MGINCIVINPSDVPTTGKDRDQKRDPRDSRKLARAIKNREVSAIWIPPIAVEEDRQLLRTRKRLSGDITRIKNRIKAILQLHGIKYPEIFIQAASHWSAKFIKWLETIQFQEVSGTEALKSQIRCLQFLRGELLTVSRKIRALSQSERYCNNHIKLIKISGVGMVTSMTILTEVCDIARFKTVDNFRAFIGLIPRANDSGEKERPGRITKRANVHLRSLLVESTWMAIRHDPYYLHLYKTYRQRMKENKALIRTAGKLANQIYFTLKNK